MSSATEQLRAKLEALGTLTVTRSPITRLYKASIEIDGKLYSAESLAETDALIQLLRKVNRVVE